MAKLYYGDISQRVGIYKSAQLLARARANIFLHKTAKKINFPKNVGKTWAARRYLRLSIPDAPLFEGVTPPAASTSWEDVISTMQQWGRWIPLTDQALDLHEDKLLDEHEDIIQQNMEETFEKIDWATIKGGTAVYYANGSARSAVNTTITEGDLKLIERDLRANYASYYRRMIKGAAKDNTYPIPASFLVVGHTDCKADIEALTNFKAVHEYASPDDMIDPYEIGSVGNFRFVLSPLFNSFPDAGGAKGTMYSTSGTLADVYPLVVLTPDCWATLDMNTPDAGQVLVGKPKVGKGTELAQEGSVGWKAYKGGAILDDSLMARLEIAVTATPS